MGNAMRKKSQSGPDDKLTPTDVSRQSVDDRMALMNMVKDGELSVEDAVAKIKARSGGNHLRRQGAVRQNRGRLNLEIFVQKSNVFSVLAVTVREGRELLAVKNNTANPLVQLSIKPVSSGLPDLEKPSLRKTKVRQNTTHPKFDEQFSWELRTDREIDNYKLHIQVSEQAVLRRSQFMGSMAFPIAEIVEHGKMDGWFRLLDAKKGEFQFIPFRPKVKNDRQAGANKQRQSLRASPSPSDAGAKAALSANSDAAASAPKTAAQKREALANVDQSSFNYLKVLGQGSFGKVLMAEHKTTNDVFAIKVLKKEVVVEDDDVECTMIERRVLALASGCPFLTNLVATFQTPERLYFVMEFVTGGDLMFHMQKLKRFTPELTAFYSAEICLGLWYLHANGVLYRDLKLDNVMLDGTGHIKITDFGMCKEAIWGAATTTTFCGTPGYLAPEIIQEKSYDASVDWWSLGVLIYEMLVGDSPFQGDDEDELFEQILKMKVVYPKRLDTTSCALLDGFLTREPEGRLGCGRDGRSNIMSHAFFAGIDWTKLEKREIDPPGYKPDIKDPRSADCFDPEFTEAETDLSPADADAIANIDQGIFSEFSFVNKTFFGEPEEAAAEVQPPRRPALFDYPWYRPGLPRNEAAKELYNKALGTFVVRESASKPGCYAITMISEEKNLWNGLITPSVTSDGETLFKLFVKQKFSSLPELIEYYYDHPVTKGQSGRMVCLARS